MNNVSKRAGLAGFMALALTNPRYQGIDLAASDVPTPAQARRWRAQRNYPQSGTGKRQGERIQRLVDRAKADPFEASKRCLVAIRIRLHRSTSHTTGTQT